MELKEFQELALRTESHISGIKLNTETLSALLGVVVSITEILDGIKKATFYHKTTKLEETYATHLDSIKTHVDNLSKIENGPIEKVITENYTMQNVDARVFHGIIGIVTEAGELVSALLKCVEDPNAVIDAINLQEEMADSMWYQAILHDTLKLDWGQGLQNVINKLYIRYPDKYSDYSAENRNLKAERSALEVRVKNIPWPLNDISGDFDRD